MKKVHLLPAEVISKIAAGEIIERPASVIKELVENALDAGADDIRIDLKEAGKTLIAVKDNGSGIEQEDLENIFLRHATSKIKNADDLEAIQSLGFRGEALYSIAAIADVTLKSRTQNQTSGWEIHLRGGKKLNLRPIPAAPGTEIEVQELFFNTPARKKFLKANTTELNQILNLFLPYAILKPHCRFLLTHQDKDLVDLPPSSNRVSRMAHALNLEEKHLIAFTKNFPEQNIEIEMILGNINLKRGRRDLQFIFVNDRPVQNRTIGFHMGQVYRLIFPPEVYPCFAVFIRVPAKDIDVNIHPAKREVKIKDEQVIAPFLRRLAEAALMAQGKTKEVLEAGIPAANLIMEPQSMRQRVESILHDVFEQPFLKPSASQKSEPFASGEEHLFFTQRDSLQGKLAAARFVGSFMNKFLLFECESNLLVIDQHAAQERILYEQLKKQSEAGQIEIQQLLTPIVLNLSPQEMLSWEETGKELEECGLSTTRFDNQTIALHSHPQLLKNPEATIRYFLAEGTVQKFDHNIIAKQACRSSIMAGDNMSQLQAEYQRNQLILCKDPFTCPHGRPTVIEITEAFLDRQFLRT